MDTITQTTTTVATANYDLQDMLEANMLAEIKQEQAISEYMMKHQLRGALLQGGLLLSDVRRTLGAVRRIVEVESYKAVMEK